MMTSLTPSGRSASLRLLALLMALVMAAVSLPLGTARAAFVSTGDARSQLSALLAREDVQLKLRRLGVDPAEAAARVEALSDTEILRLAGQGSEMASGQDSGDFTQGFLIGGAIGLALFAVFLAWAFLTGFMMGP